MVAPARIRDRCQRLPKVRRSNEVASSSIDGRRDTRGFGTGGFGGARASQAQESTFGTALASVSEDASGLKERRILHEFALVLTGADAQERLQVKKVQRA
jgi:hypothetical protein